MIGVSDILKILDQVPLWKTLKALPQRIETLETRVAELEKAKSGPVKEPGEPCPSCGAHALRRTSTKRSEPPHGDLGFRDEVWTCTACGALDERVMTPPNRRK